MAGMGGVVDGGLMPSSAGVRQSISVIRLDDIKVKYVLVAFGICGKSSCCPSAEKCKLGLRRCARRSIDPDAEV